jgi:UDP-N-acetylmuramyl tripeptide synthase
MVKQGCQAAAMEVSSHGLAQGRCDQIDFDVAVFTNLSQDHLDYHQTMIAYALEKAKLFTSLSPDKTAIVNKSSPWTETILEHCKARILTYGFTPRM